MKVKALKFYFKEKKLDILLYAFVVSIYSFYMNGSTKLKGYIEIDQEFCKGCMLYIEVCRKDIGRRILSRGKAIVTLNKKAFIEGHNYD